MTISKKVRFEVFKRDKFTCQYCGREAPEVVLHADHITPKSKGGTDDLLNLITACIDCNQGKGARNLADDTAIKKRKRQLDELQDRREQLEMLIDWHQSIMDIAEQEVHALANIWGELTGYCLTEWGLANLKRWIKRFGLNETVEAMKIATSEYLEYSDEDPARPVVESVEKAADYVPRICNHRKRCREKPYLKALYYARGILRNRLHYLNEWKSIQLMDAAVQAGHSTDEIQDMAKTVNSWTEFKNIMEDWGIHNAEHIEP